MPAVRRDPQQTKGVGGDETEERRIVLNATPGSAASSEDKMGWAGAQRREDRAGKTGFEPATSGVTNQHSNQLILCLTCFLNCHFLPVCSRALLLL